MDSEEVKLGVIALVMFIVYTALMLESLYRENSTRRRNPKTQDAPR